MKIYYYKSEKGNVGDDFNEWLWPKIFKQEIFDNNNNLFIGIGSILDDRFSTSVTKNVFGAGARSSETVPKIDDTWNFHFVRGPKTAEAFTGKKIKFITDPGILAGQFFRKKSSPKEIGVIPYYQYNQKSWMKIAAKSKTKLIPPHLNVDSFFTQLSECKLVITESLHGAIFADALRIPWVPFVSYSRYAEGDINNFKWNDWFGSLNLAARRENFPVIWPQSPINLVEKTKAMAKISIATQKINFLIHRKTGYLSQEEISRQKTNEILYLVQKINDEKIIL